MEPMTLSDVLYVPRMKKSLVSISIIEDKGFGVYVLDGKVHVFPKDWVHFPRFPLESDVGNFTSYYFTLIILWHTIEATMICASYVLHMILPHMVDHTFMAFPIPLQTL